MNVKLENKPQSKEGQAELLTAAKQTTRSWASLVETCQNVPPVFAPFFAAAQAAGKAMPYTVISPTFEGYVQKQPQTLTCAMDEQLFILEKQKNTFKTLCFPFSGIYLIEFNSALLDSILIIKGVTSFGNFDSAFLRFNAVSDSLYQPFIDQIRRSRIKPGPAEPKETFAELEKSSFKLANYARAGLLAGDAVRQVIFQGQLRKSPRKIALPGFFHTNNPAHVYLLTKHEFILIRETSLPNRKDTYGGIWDYIPLNKIKHMTVNERWDGLMRLSIQLVDDNFLDTLFQPERRAQVEQMVKDFGEG